MFIFFNANPVKNVVGDCVIRAISVLAKLPWEVVHDEICDLSGVMYDMPSSNEVWSEYLRILGYERGSIPNTCPSCYTVRAFCRDHKRGRFLVATGSHVVAIINGDYYDTWDSGDEAIIYYWKKETKNGISY